MITYEEFLKQNNINELKFLDFTNSGELVFDANISDSPAQYIDVAKKALELNSIRVPGIQTEQFYRDLAEFIKNCSSNLGIYNCLLGRANKEEFSQGEDIIEKVISEINPEWSTKQKLAYVHYKMGELVSYVPDFRFQNINGSIDIAKTSRNIWKSLTDKASVCNGITYIQRNILSRLGIETEELSSGIHSFMLTKTDEGNIITDATWDLSNSLYKAKPMYFGVTYEELRKQEEGISNSHKLDNPPQNVLKISDEELRDIYQSIGIIDSSRRFPIPIYELAKEINSKEFENSDQKLTAFLDAFIKKFPEEATHLQETREFLEDAISELGFSRDIIQTKFIYSKNDDICEKSILSIYINNPNKSSNYVSILNIDKLSFDKLDLKELDENFKVHDFDEIEPFWKSKLKEKSLEIEQQQEK